MSMKKRKFFNQEKQRPDLMAYLPKKGFKRFAILYLANFWKISTASIWALLLSLPVFTFGLASVGMTYVARNVVLQNHVFGTTEFFDTIKKNWKQALGAGILNLLITAVILYAVVVCYANASGMIMVFVIIALVELFLFFTLVQHYLWHIIVTFNTNLGSAYFTAIRLAAVGVKRNLLALLALGIFGALLMAVAFVPFFKVQLLAYIILLCIMPGYCMYAVAYSIFPVIKKRVIDPYYEAHPDADVELRKNVNLMDENEADKQAL